MNGEATKAPVLVLTWGNPSRGDDAIGPTMFDLLEEYQRHTGQLENVDLLTDFQLQIEHAVDLENRQCVLFVDAGLACSEPFELQRLQAEKDDSFTTHAMSPAAVLSVYQQVHQAKPPPAYLLTIRAYQFGLGLEMTRQARSNVQDAFKHITSGQWLEAAKSL